MKCSKCGRSTGMSTGVCLPCEYGLKSVKGAAQAFRKGCKRCGAPLTSIESRRRGYGPECWEKVGVPWDQIPLVRSRFARDAVTVTKVEGASDALAVDQEERPRGTAAASEAGAGTPGPSPSSPRRP